MSGGVGPTGGGVIALEPSPATSEVEPTFKAAEDRQGYHRSDRVRVMFFSFRQLNALAIATVLAASSTVSFPDIALSILSLPYLYLLSSCFASPHSCSSPAAHSTTRSLLRSMHSFAGVLLGMILPVAYVLDGLLSGDKEGVSAAAPHLFVMAAQSFLEGVAASPRFSPAARALVPVLYNGRRLFTLGDWVNHELGKAGGHHGAPRRLATGQALAVANLAFWGVNFFAFLLPIYLPRAMQLHYLGDEEVKPSAEDDEELKNKLKKAT